MMVFKGVSIIVLCLMILNMAKVEAENEDGENHVWNFFFGGGKEKKCETSKASAAYVRWGRDDCNPNTSDIVYSGFVGGGRHSQSGAGTNSLCLPETPEYDDDLTAGGSWSLLYGAEFETGSYTPFSHVHEGDIVCAVCLTRGRSTTLMIPAKTTCPSGWTKEYGGLLMGSYKDYSGHNYLCIDRNPETRPGSTADNEGQLFYATEGVCGSLSCPPYVNGKEMPCVVCTK